MKLVLRKGPYDWTVAEEGVHGPETKNPGQPKYISWGHYMTLAEVRRHAPEVVAKRSKLRGAPAEILEQAVQAVESLIAYGEVSL